MRKHVFSGFIICLLLLLSFPVFADRERKLEINTNMFVHSGQNIIYDYGMYSENISVYGAGGQIGVMYNLHERFALGTNLGYEFFLYEDFHDYRDIKLTAEMRIRINRLKNDFFNWHVKFKVGTDYVIRDDKAVSLYYLHGFGTSFDLKINDSIYFTAGSDIEITLQIGSDVAHYNHYLGVTWLVDNE